jgi:transcriptional regulator with XRE-family HTH domain
MYYTSVHTTEIPMLSSSPSTSDAATVAANLRRVMAREGLTFDDVVAATGLDDRTLRALVRARNNPHARTIHKLAAGLGISVDELLRPPARWSSRGFDRAANSLVDGVVARHAELFAHWSDADFDELYSRFGTGGQLTEEGILAAAQSTNARRDLWRQVSVILESSEAQLLAEFVDSLYRRATISAPLTDGQPHINDCQLSAAKSRNKVL